MKLIESEVTLSAHPAEVWEALTDFESYGEWNPFITRMEARVGEGESFRAMSRLPTGLRLGFVGGILSVVPEEELAWVGRPMMMHARAMEIRHTFTLEPQERGTSLHQLEAATGLLIPMSGWILDQAQKGQVAMNEALERKLTETQPHRP